MSLDPDVIIKMQFGGEICEIFPQMFADPHLFPISGTWKESCLECPIMYNFPICQSKWCFRIVPIDVTLPGQRLKRRRIFKKKKMVWRPQIGPILRSVFVNLPCEYQVKYDDIFLNNTFCHSSTSTTVCWIHTLVTEKGKNKRKQT